MSAIWGYIITKSSKTVDNIESELDNCMANYKLDRIDYKYLDSAKFFCGHQFFTNEALFDESPIVSSDSNVIFGGDCYLYNRNELITLLYDEPEIKALKGIYSRLGDVSLAYIAYQKWGVNFVEHIRGMFSFAIYNKSDSLLYLFADHTATRYLAYRIEDDNIVFGSTYDPFIKTCKGNFELNEKFIAHVERDSSPVSFYFPDITMIKNVFHVGPGHYKVVDTKSMTVNDVHYWNPKKLRKAIKLNSHEEYKRLFVDTFQKSVNDTMRARKETGIFLSSGLDSSSVAAFAAPRLAEDNKKLFSFTAIPSTGFKYKNDESVLENESEGIWIQKKRHSNIEPSFAIGNEGNCFTYIKEYQDLYKEPIKPIGNLPNINLMIKMAQEKECSIVLVGTNGNTTISYGNVFRAASINLLSGHWIRCAKVINSFCSARRIPKKKFIPFWIKKIIEYIFAKKESVSKYQGMLNSKLLKEYSIMKYINNRSLEFGTQYYATNKTRRDYALDEGIFQHVGYYNTCNSLRFGVLTVDPTKTVEIIELCLALPIECFVHGGKERCLVRDYLKEYIPMEILTETKGHGSQGADIAYRVNRDWEIIKEGVYSALKNDKLLKYFDKNRLDELIESIKNNEGELDIEHIIKAAPVFSFSLFLDEFADVAK